jgi:hypothetical protein
MESEPQKPVDPAPPPPLEQPEVGIFEAYANVTDADWSLTDVTLRFMQLIYLAKEEGATTRNRDLVVLERADITIPWWQAKVLASTLTKLVQSYEAVNGELRQPILPKSSSSSPSV